MLDIESWFAIQVHVHFETSNHSREYQSFVKSLEWASIRLIPTYMQENNAPSRKDTHADLPVNC